MKLVPTLIDKKIDLFSSKVNQNLNKFKCGIVGLPNVGKSTLFNALTASKNAEAANFPFCTIDPNIGIVEVPDARLDKLADLSDSKKNLCLNNIC